MGEGTAWRDDPSKRRVLTLLTYGWAGLFALRLVVQVPLYFAGNIEALGTTKLLMGLPLYAPLLVVSWLVVRSIYPKPAAMATPRRHPRMSGRRPVLELSRRQDSLAFWLGRSHPAG